MSVNPNKTIPMRLPGGGQVAIIKESEMPAYLRMGWVRFDGKESNPAPVSQEDPELEDFAAKQEARRLAEASGSTVEQVQREQATEGEEPPARKRGKQQ